MIIQRAKMSQLVLHVCLIGVVIVVQTNAGKLGSLTSQDFDNARDLAPAAGGSTYEEDKLLFRAGMFEGDIAGLERKDLHNFFKKYRDSFSNGGDAAEEDDGRVVRWPKGVVPYVLDQGFTGNERARIARAIREFHTKTCIRFVPQVNQFAHIIITKRDNGCYSYLGRTGRRQPVNIASECIQRHGIILHELSHVLGLFHEQSRPDRDDYVKIQLQNIDSGAEDQFDKYPINTYPSRAGIDFGFPYDYGSVMHYGQFAFSKNRRRTIVATRKGAPSALGQRVHLSALDAGQLNRMYCS